MYLTLVLNFFDRFNELSDLGGQLLLHNPGLTEVKDRLGKLASERAAVEKGLKEKGDWLKQCLDLQNFNKEADHIDTTTSIHEAFLEFTDLGVSILTVNNFLGYFFYILSQNREVCEQMTHIARKCL